MKIERINENQIRCTLTREDLDTRKIKLSELAYGSEKAKSLFRDMMQKAADDFGFEANNIPLMIEAIPVSSDSIILIITKVENPEELDARFSRFSPEEDGPSRSHASLSEMLSGADDILDLIQKISQGRKSASEKKEAVSDDTDDSTGEELTLSLEEASEEAFHLTRFYLFHDLETVIRASRILAPHYSGPNVLFKNPEDNNYYLLLKKADTDPRQFNRICNILSEYGLQVSYSSGMEEFFTEHMEVLIPDQALQQLSAI